ncbi:MAG: hypothetical protein ACOX7R_11355 [Acetivibrionales bacterium]|jgi:hypothetical protein
MSTKYEELKTKIERIREDESGDLYFEVVDAYEKGEIDCNQYVELYDAFKISVRNFAS